MENGVLEFGELKVDLFRGRVFLKGDDIYLTRKEYQILTFLAKHPGKFHSVNDILDEVWGVGFAITEAPVRFHIWKLKRKLGTHFFECRPGIGYSFAGISEEGLQ